jgi:hypothetical protein
MKPTLLCWLSSPENNVTEESQYCALVFARTELRARILGAAQVELRGEGADFVARRAPEFDAHAPGPVPHSAMLAEGWLFECAFCGHMVDKDGCEECIEAAADAPEADAHHTVVGEEPAVEGQDVYCSNQCAELARNEREARTAMYAAAEAEMVRRWPGATRTSRWLGVDDRVYVHFTFPGGQHDVLWIVGEKEVRVHLPDVERWKRYVTELPVRSDS